MCRGQGKEQGRKGGGAVLRENLILLVRVDVSASTWRTFLASHASELWTMDLTTHPLWNYSVRYVLVLMELPSRRVVHVAVTPSPTLAWVKQRIREATPFGSVLRFLVHDNDGIFGQSGRCRLGEAGRSYRSALDLWLGEVLDIKGVPTVLAAGAQAGLVVPGHAPRAWFCSQHGTRCF